MTIQHTTQTNRQTKRKMFWLFRIWIISRNSIIRIIGILGVTIGMGIIIQQSNQCQNQLKPNQAIQLFMQIDDLGHEWITDLRKRWNYNHAIEKFEQIDAKFHTTSNMNEKFKLAIEMSVLFEEVDTYIHKVWGVNTPEDILKDKKYHELANLFNQLLK